MVSEKKGIPVWGKIVLAGAGIVGGIFAIYELATMLFAPGTTAASKQLTTWSDDLAKELADIAAAGRTPTAAEELAIKTKQQEIDDAYTKLFTIYYVTADVLGAAIAAAMIGYIVTRMARDYWNTHVGSCKTPADYIMLYRSCEAIDLYSIGDVSLASAWNTQTNTIYNSSISPYLQTEVTALQTSLTTLIGTELEMTELLITNLEISIYTTIPNLLLETTEFLGA